MRRHRAGMLAAVTSSTTPAAVPVTDPTIVQSMRTLWLIIWSSTAPSVIPAMTARVSPSRIGTAVCQRIDQAMVLRRVPNATRMASSRRRVAELLEHGDQQAGPDQEQDHDGPDGQPALDLREPVGLHGELEPADVA